MTNWAFAVNKRYEQRENDEIRLIGRLLTVLLCRTEEQVQQMHVLHEHYTELIQ